MAAPSCVRRPQSSTPVLIWNLVVALFLSAHPGPGALAQVMRALPDSIATFPVRLDGNVLFSIHQGVRGWSPEKRAQSMTDRIRNVADDPLVEPDSILDVDRPEETEIIAGDRLLLVIRDDDAAAYGVSRQVLTSEYAARIRSAVAQYRDDHSARSLIRSIALAIAATILFVVLIRLLPRGFQRLLVAADTWSRLGRIGSQKIVQASWIIWTVAALLKVFRGITYIVLVYLYVEVMLSLLPWTKALGGAMSKLTLGPLSVLAKGFVEEIPNLLFLAVLAVVTTYVLKFLKFFFAELGKGKVEILNFDADWARPTYSIVRFLVIAFSLVVAYPYIPGSGSNAFQGISIFFGLLLSFGSSSAVANIVAGVIHTYMRAFKVGDFVKIGDSEGNVIASGFLVTKIRTIKNVEISVPNSIMLSSHVTNYSAEARQRRLILHTSVTIGYDTPWRQVHALLLRAAGRTPALLKDPAPFILQTALNDFYVTYELNAYTVKADEMPYTYSDMHRNIQDEFNEYGVQIMSPNYLADRSVPTVVPKERWYAPPAAPPEADQSAP
jgi:small-conductance mechanosensitive channel